MKSAWKRIRDNYVALWLFIGLGLVSFTAGVRTHEQMSLSSIREFQATVKHQALSAALKRRAVM